MDEKNRPLQITDVVAVQPVGGRSIEAATAPSINSVATGAGAGSDAISTMNAHLRQERSVEGKRAWPERLASNKAAAIEKFEARKRRDELAAEASTGEPA